MKIQDIDVTITAYNRVNKVVQEKALEKIRERDLAANKGQQSSFIRYLVLEEFYVDDDNEVVVIMGFQDPAPYSGTEEVVLTQRDLEDL